jgi:hypothetical protein
MELSVIAVTLGLSMTLALVGAYAAVWLVLLCVRRGATRAEERLLKLPVGTARQLSLHDPL